MVGPVLVKQDVVEAKENVQKRIDYIGGEVYVLYTIVLSLLSLCTFIAQSWNLALKHYFW